MKSTTLSNATKPRQLFGKYATFTLRWVIQMKNHSFMSSLPCNNTKHYRHCSYLVGPERKCICDQSTISEITYAHCACKKGFTGNAYISGGCQGQYMFLPCVCVCVCASASFRVLQIISIKFFKSFMIFEIQTLMNAKSSPTHVEKGTLVLILKETITAWPTRKKTILIGKITELLNP